MDRDEWPEVSSAAKLGRREVIAKGNRERVSLPEALYGMRELGLLSVSGAGLTEVPDRLAALSGLRELLLFDDTIVRVSPALSRLGELRALDLSGNRIAELPPEPFAALPRLASLNLSRNSLEALPPLRLPSLARLDASRNLIADLGPACHAANVRLAEIAFAGNRVERVPSDLRLLEALRDLDLSDNALTRADPDLAAPPRLKSLRLSGNPFEDARFAKLVLSGAEKKVLEFLKRSRAPPPPAAPAGPPERGFAVSSGPSGPTVALDGLVGRVRPHAVFCLVRGLRFDESSFRAFIVAQSALHETECEDRAAATLATHDADRLPPGGLRFRARPPHDIRLVPLGADSECTALDLHLRYRREADERRRLNRRPHRVGVARYATVLDGEPLHPCLEDSEGRVVSLPPVTNCEGTKMGPGSTAALVEVTSSRDLGACRRAADALLEWLLESGVGGRPLQVVAGRVVDAEGRLRSTYPSKGDLSGAKGVKNVGGKRR